jgi:galactose-1-phosphate uridylyltransferase
MLENIKAQGNDEEKFQRNLSRESLGKILQTSRLDDVSADDIFQLFRDEEALHNYLPDAICQTDPRDGSLIIYNSARSRRPHDNAILLSRELENKPCPVCLGNTTGVIDVADQSQGFTFINKNLFPILYDMNGGANAEKLGEVLSEIPLYRGIPAYGLHFLQWTSSYHDKDWQNMPLEDRIIALQRLALLERKLLFETDGRMPPSEPWDNLKKAHGYVSIIKNYGSLVGGSLAHGHQQIAFSNIMPKRLSDNWNFYEQRGERFADFILRENPPEFTVRDYGKAVLLVPYFMKRPYNMMLIFRDTSKQYLCELNPDEITAAAQGWHDAIRAILDIMPRIGKEAAYNVTTHNGPGAGLYFEFLPYTQETGGFEHLGLWVCQGNPEHVSSALREFFAE